MMRSSVDRPGVKPPCCGRCLANIVLFIRARKPWPEQIEVICLGIWRSLISGLFLCRVEELWRGPVSGDDTVFPYECEKRK